MKTITTSSVNYQSIKNYHTTNFSWYILFLLSILYQSTYGQTESIGVKAKPVAKIEKTINKLNEEISATKKKENPIIATYVVTYKDKKGKNTGAYFLVHQREGETIDYVKNQAKLNAGDTNYLVQREPILKGYCGILSQITSTGVLRLKPKIVGGKNAVDKIKTRIDRTNDQEVLEVICN